MAQPDEGPYREALLRARQALAELDPEVARQVLRALQRFADEVGRRLRGRFGAATARELAERAALARSEEIIRRTAAEVAAELERSVRESRNVAFRRVLSIWREAGRLAAGSVGVPDALLGAVRVPPITMLGAWDAVGSPRTWRTLLNGHVLNAAAEARQIVELGFLEGVGPDELGRRLRRYVVGSEPFHTLFEDVPTLSGEVAKIDLRRIPRRLRDQARQMKHNAERLAFSEVHNARREAELQHFHEDPFIAAVQWELSPDRGISNAVPCECDVLASNDFYGLGAGIYPVDRVPPEPHPWGRCSQIPVTRDSRLIDRPKPSPARQRPASQARIPQGGDITTARRRSLLDRAERALRFAEEGARERAA